MILGFWKALPSFHLGFLGLVGDYLSVYTFLGGRALQAGREGEETGEEITGPRLERKHIRQQAKLPLSTKFISSDRLERVVGLLPEAEDLLTPRRNPQKMTFLVFIHFI